MLYAKDVERNYQQGKCLLLRCLAIHFNLLVDFHGVLHKYPCFQTRSKTCCIIADFKRRGTKRRHRLGIDNDLMDIYKHSRFAMIDERFGIKTPCSTKNPTK